MKKLLSYDQRVRQGYAGAAARRRLNDLRPCLYRDVTEFVKTGRKPTPRNVKSYLKSTGTVGAVDPYVAEILKHVPDAQAAAAEFS
jgi:hypothetical protein